MLCAQGERMKVEEGFVLAASVLRWSGKEAGKVGGEVWFPRFPAFIFFNITIRR